MIQNTVFEHIEENYYSQVDAQIDGLSTFFEVDPLLPLNNMSRQSLVDQTLSMLGLSSGGVMNLTTTDKYLESLFEVDETTDVNILDDAEIIGDPEDLGSITVIDGTVTVTTTFIATESRLHNCRSTVNLPSKTMPVRRPRSRRRVPWPWSPAAC